MKYLKYFESFEENYFNPNIRYATPLSGNIMNFSIDDIKKIIMNAYKSEKGLPDRKMEEILNCDWLDVAEVVDLWYHMNPPKATGPNVVDSDVADFKDRPSAEEIYNYIQSHPFKYSKRMNNLNQKTGIFENFKDVKIDTSKYDSYRTKYDLSEEEIDDILNKTKNFNPLNVLSDKHNTTIATIERILDMHEFGLDRKSSIRLIPNQRPSAKQIYNYLQTKKNLKNLELNKKTGIFENKKQRSKYDLDLYEIEEIIRRAEENNDQWEKDSASIDMPRQLSTDLHQKLCNQFNIPEEHIDDIIDMHFFGYDYQDSPPMLVSWKRPSAHDIYKHFLKYKETHPIEFTKTTVDFNQKTGLYD